jgi:hypothetical protein
MIGQEDLPTSTATMSLHGLELLQLPTGEVGVSSITATLEHSPPQFETSTEDSLSATVYSVYQKSTKVLISIDLGLQNSMEYSEGDEGERGTDFETLFLLRHFAEGVGPWQVTLWAVMKQVLMKIQGWTCTIMATTLRSLCRSNRYVIINPQTFQYDVSQTGCVLPRVECES